MQEHHKPEHHKSDFAPPGVFTPGNPATACFNWVPNPGGPGGGYWTSVTGTIQQVDPNGAWITLAAPNNGPIVYVALNNVKFINIT
jgi:hypothetical protein